MQIEFETYTCGKDDNRVEWGFCFKSSDSDEVILPDLVLGELTYEGEADAKRIEQSWVEYEWMAQAIVDAAAKRGS